MKTKTNKLYLVRYTIKKNHKQNTVVVKYIYKISCVVRTLWLVSYRVYLYQAMQTRLWRHSIFRSEAFYHSFLLHGEAYK